MKFLIRLSLFLFVFGSILPMNADARRRSATSAPPPTLVDADKPVISPL